MPQQCSCKTELLRISHLVQLKTHCVDLKRSSSVCTDASCIPKGLVWFAKTVFFSWVIRRNRRHIKTLSLGEVSTPYEGSADTSSQCWATVCDAGPTLDGVLFLLGYDSESVLQHKEESTASGFCMNVLLFAKSIYILDKHIWALYIG